MKCPVPVWQDEREIEWLIDEAHINQATNYILEIGSLNGGTVWHWINLLVPRFVISIDKRVGKDDPRYADQKSGHNGLWHKWAKEKNGSFVLTLDSLSQYGEAVNFAKKNSPYDFVFVDGGHSYDEVKADYTNYLPMIRSGGIMAFHDINDYSRCPDVPRFWNEIKRNHKYAEMAMRKNEWGIGIIYVD
jgi:hypothetical protein